MQGKTRTEMRYDFAKGEWYLTEIREELEKEDDNDYACYKWVTKNSKNARIEKRGEKLMFKEKQRVWTIGRGWGEVIGIELEKSYPVVVKFDSGNVYSYTSDGKSSIVEPCFRELFFREIYIPEEVYQYECKDNVNVELELKVRLEEIPSDRVNDLIEYSNKWLLEELVNKISDETDLYEWKRIKKVSFEVKRTENTKKERKKELEEL